MKTAAKKTATWTTVGKELKGWEKSALIALIKDLHATAAVNRDLLHARVCPEADEGELLEKYRRKIVEQFFPARGMFGKLKLGEARQAVRDFRKATGSVPGTAELLMTYVENGVKFTCEYGDITEGFYNSVESALKELAALLRGEGKALYPVFSERLGKFERQTDGIGWGFHDYIADLVGSLDEELSGG